MSIDLAVLRHKFKEKLVEESSCRRLDVSPQDFWELLVIAEAGKELRDELQCMDTLDPKKINGSYEWRGEYVPCEVAGAIEATNAVWRAKRDVAVALFDSSTKEVS